MNKTEGVKNMKVRGRKGTILVETAFVMPILLVLFLGIFEFGRILMIKQMITNAARESARVAAINLDDSGALASAETVAQDYLTRCNVDLSQTTVNPVFSTVNGANAVQVTIRYNYATALNRWVPGIPETLDLTSRAVMRREA